MVKHADVRNFLRFLRENPNVRARIRAPRDKTLLYAGAVFQPVWREIEEDRRALGPTNDKLILPDVLAGIRLPPAIAHPDLLAWVKSLDRHLPWSENGYIVWRAVSGIFASNASGAVSFMIGSGVSTSAHKVFAATEAGVLDRNPDIDPVSRDLLQYYLRCIREGDDAMNVTLMHGSS